MSVSIQSPPLRKWEVGEAFADHSTTKIRTPDTNYRREMSLGPLHRLGLADARQAAEDARTLLRQGINPIEYRRGAAVIEAEKNKAAGKTFGDYADAYIDDAVKAGRWRGAKTEAGWRNTLTNHAAPLRPKSLADIDVQDVIAVLRPLWGVKQESAEKLRERIERVLDAAQVESLRSGDNPARWRGNLEHVLHKLDKKANGKHHPALPYKQMAVFMKHLRRVERPDPRLAQ